MDRGSIRRIIRAESARLFNISLPLSTSTAKI